MDKQELLHHYCVHESMQGTVVNWTYLQIREIPFNLRRDLNICHQCHVLVSLVSTYWLKLCLNLFQPQKTTTEGNMHGYACFPNQIFLPTFVFQTKYFYRPLFSKPNISTNLCFPNQIFLLTFTSYRFFNIPETAQGSKNYQNCAKL